MADAMIESQLEASAGVPVRVVSDARASSENKNIFGGKNMSQTDLCTSAFKVDIAAPNSGSGALGAGHCNSVRQQAVTMTNLVGVNSSNMDVRLLRIPSQHNAQPKFWQGTKHRRVHGVWTGTQGSPVCHYGKNSGKSCGVITVTPYEPPASHCPNSPGCTAFAVLVEGPSLRTCRGDSGGPWFRAFSGTNRRAVGVHEGGSGFDDCVTPDQEATYVPINSVLSFLSNFQNWGAVTLNT